MADNVPSGVPAAGMIPQPLLEAQNEIDRQNVAWYLSKYVMKVDGGCDFANENAGENINGGRGRVVNEDDNANDNVDNDNGGDGGDDGGADGGEDDDMGDDDDDAVPVVESINVNGRIINIEDVRTAWMEEELNVMPRMQGVYHRLGVQIGFSWFNEERVLFSHPVSGLHVYYWYIEVEFPGLEFLGRFRPSVHHPSAVKVVGEKAYFKHKKAAQNAALAAGADCISEFLDTYGMMV